MSYRETLQKLRDAFIEAVATLDDVFGREITKSDKELIAEADALLAQKEPEPQVAFLHRHEDGSEYPIYTTSPDLQARVEELERQLAEAQKDAAITREQTIEECAKACQTVSDDYDKNESRKWPELRSDAKTGADDCEHAIRALGSKT